MVQHEASEVSWKARRLDTAILVLFALPLTTAACTGPLQGVVDYDQGRDFSQITRLAFFEDANPPERPPTKARIQVRAQLESQLEAKGFTLTSPEDAQLLVIYHVGGRAKVRMGSTTSSRAAEASLAVEMRDPTTNRSAWYGTVEQTWRGDEDTEERITTAVRILLERFPPEGSAEKTYDGEERIRETY